MSRKIKSHPVEKAVDAYLVRFSKTPKLGRQKAVVERASKLIGAALNDPCCSEEEVIFGKSDSSFIVQLTSLLNGIDTRKWRESLERAKTALDNKIENPCCD